MRGLVRNILGLDGDLLKQISRRNQPIAQTELHIRDDLLKDARDLMQARKIILIVLHGAKGGR